MAASVASYTSSKPESLIIAFLVGGVAGFVPDIDTKNSTITVFAQRRLDARYSNFAFSKKQRTEFPEILVYFTFMILEVLLGSMLYAFSQFFLAFFGHRGITHTLFVLFALLVSLLVASYVLGISALFPVLFCVGYGSHILTDALTVSGVAMLVPFTSKKIYLLPKKIRLKTGSSREALITIGVCLLALAFILNRIH